jgi:hypothetical protein
MPPRTGRLPRRTPIKARNAKRGGHRFPKRVDEAFRDWIRSLPCCLRGCITRTRVECAHVKTRGAGGEDVGNCVPLCRAHHEHQHLIGIKSFQAFHHVDLKDLAARTGADFLAVWADHRGDE